MLAIFAMVAMPATARFLSISDRLILRTLALNAVSDPGPSHSSEPEPEFERYSHPAPRRATPATDRS